jgi:hypothetical protein
MNNIKLLTLNVLSKVMPHKKQSLQKAIISRYRIIDVQAPESGGYKESLVSFGGALTSVKYLETSYGYFVKPMEHCYKAQFEYFFGFGAGNMGWDSNRTVFVTSLSFKK